MKTEIHPDYREVHGALYVRERIRDPFRPGDLHVEICSNCHPFYTGKQKLMDTGGRVERFQRKLARSGRIRAASPPPHPDHPTLSGLRSSSRAGLPITGR